MVKYLLGIFVFVLGVLSGYGLRHVTTGPDVVLKAGDWVCFVIAHEDGTCVAYRMSDERLEDLDRRYRKHNPPERKPLRPVQ